MVQRAVNLKIVGALSRANSASNVLVTPETSRFLREILEKALANPAGVAPPWADEARALLANILVNDYLHGWNDTDKLALDRAESEMQVALRNDPDLVLAHHAKGLIHRARGDHKAALKAFERAVKLDGNFARAHAQKANLLTLQGDPNKALPYIEAAIKLSPYDPALGTFYWIKGRAHFVEAQSDDAKYNEEQYNKSIASLEKSVKLLPTVWYNWLYLVSAWTHQDVNKAKARLAQFASQPHFHGFTLASVKKYERANPDDHPYILKAREALRKGLEAAGMK